MINPGDHRERVSYLVAEIAREDPLLFSVLWEAVAQYVDNSSEYLERDEIRSFPEDNEDDAKTLERVEAAEVLLSDLDKRNLETLIG